MPGYTQTGDGMKTGHVGKQMDRTCWNAERKEMLEYRQTGHVRIQTDVLIEIQKDRTC